MAQSTQRAVSDGSLAVLDLSIDYLDRSEITVFYDAVLSLSWSWVGTSEKRISFAPPVPVGVEVLVKRTTNISILRHQFTLGAAFTYQTLDEDLTQVLHIAQEASEANLSGQFYADIDMHNYRIRNIGTAVNDSDALSLAQYKADASGANAAKVAAQSAQAGAVAALASSTAFTSRGAWATAQAYIKNNLVTQSGSAYIVNSNHTSGVFATDLAAGRLVLHVSKGDAGPANTLTIGTVSQGTAAASITGTSPNQVLNLVLQKGDQGIQGPAGTSGTGSGDMAKIENLSGLTSYSTARANLGLGNVDNTSDANKPISTAQATALAAKAPTASPTFTGTVSGVTAAMVGLGSVDNTADTAKPVSTAQQTALDLKAPLASPTFTGTPAAPNPNPLSNTTDLTTTSWVRALLNTLCVFTFGAQTIAGVKTFSNRSVHTGAYTPANLPLFNATPVFDCTLSNVFEPEALTANITSITMSNVAVGQTIQIRFLQDATGGRTVAVPAGAKIDGTPNTAANRVNILVMTYSGRGARWEGNWLVVPA